MRALLVILALTGMARADSSIGALTGDFDAERCTMNDAPYRHDWDSATVKRLQPKGLYLKQAAGRHHLLFVTSFSDQPPRAVAVDERTGRTVAAIANREVVLIESESGELLGLLPIHDLAPAGGVDSGSALVVGDTLVVALFHRIATGAALVALDVKSHAIKWKADVEQMNVPHSKYFNDVSLARRGDVVVMRGYEAAGCYQQTFALATGRRISSTLHAAHR